MTDPEKRLEDWTDEQIKTYFHGRFNLGIGVHMAADTNKWLQYFSTVLQPGDRFPIQIGSGPLLSLRYISRLPDYLVQMVRDNKVELIVHLPFVLSMYKDYSALKYQRDFFRELFQLYNSYSIPYKMVFHCGHPSTEFLKRNNEAAAEKMFVQNLISSVIPMSSNGKLLIENLASNDWVSWQTPQALYERYFARGNLDATKFGLCIDTEHLFGSGYQIESLYNKVDISVVDCIHLNSAPQIVQLGSGIDLHSYTEIESSILGNGGVFYREDKASSEEALKKFLLWSEDKPRILERHLMSIKAKDIEYCSRLLGEK